MPEATVPDPEAWDGWTPQDLASRLRQLQIRWAVAGGWALDLYASGEPQQHSDIEIAIDGSSFERVRAALPTLVWFVVDSGQVTAIEDAPGNLHQTWGWDPSGGCWRLDVLREPWQDDSWVYRRDPAVRRPLTQAIERTVDGIPYLSPEIVLLYKAKTPRPKDESDFARLLPLLNSNRSAWLAAALRTAHPAHHWLSLLAG